MDTSRWRLALLLGHDAMDDAHRAFADLLARAQAGPEALPAAWAAIPGMP